MVYSQLRNHVENRMEVTEEEMLHFSSLATFTKLKKREYFHRAGDICSKQAFILKGAMRAFFTDEKAHEHVVQLGFEDWWFADLGSYLSDSNASLSIEAIEDCELLVFEKKDIETMMVRYPRFERYYRIMIQSAYVAAQLRMINTMSKSAEERYLDLIKKYHGIELRVTQHNIASYLGITPEALSRIKRKLITEHR